MGRLLGLWGGVCCPAAGSAPLSGRLGGGVVVVGVVVVVSLGFCVRVPEFLLASSLPAFSHNDVGGRDPSSPSSRASIARSFA